MDTPFPVLDTGSTGELPGLLGDIVYIVPVEDTDPYQASFLQGFARSLMRHVPIIRMINTLPSDLWELTPEERDVRLARRMSGQAPVRWFAQCHRALSSMVKQRFLATRRALEKQDGYGFDANTAAQARIVFGAERGEELRPHFLMLERASELKLATECLATLAASEVSAVLRLPNRVNRTAGQARQFAQQYHARKTTERKRIEVFRHVQHAVMELIPEDFLPFIEDAEEGIRLICDAQLMTAR
jgi:hypothetical protein